MAKLKDTIAACEGHEYGVDLTTLEAKALLARLEAAEAVIKYLVHTPMAEEKEHPCPHCLAMKAWRESKGQ